MKRILLLALFSCYGIFLFAQSHEEECIYGNCKNGRGVKFVKGNKKNPFPFVKVWSPLDYYYFYEIGNFKDKALNGEGYRISYWRTDDNTKNWIISQVKNNSAFTPEAQTQAWFEKGNYENGFLQGQGVLVEFDAANVSPYRIREGNFTKGTLNGDGIKITKSADGFIKVAVENNLYKVITGSLFRGVFVDDLCTACTLTEYRGDVEANTIGKVIQENFLSGWVIKDFEVNSYNNQRKKVTPYRSLYVGGIELKRMETTELSVNSKTVELPDGSSFTGELDAEGRPSGFGVLTSGSSKNPLYEGFVEDGKPNGWGYAPGNDTYGLGDVIGGYYKNGVIMYGVAHTHPGIDQQVLKFGHADGKTDPRYNSNLKKNMEGPYLSQTYSYDVKTRRHVLSREESGEYVEGMKKDVWVSLGRKDEETRRQRKVENNFISISDLTVGDIVVVNGMASPVVGKTASVFNLKNGKSVSSVSAVQVQLSKHSIGEFSKSCDVCHGTAEISYTYQRPPEDVVLERYEFETEVLDYTIVKKTVKVSSTYKKTFPPQLRTRACDACSGKGLTLDVAEIPE